MKLPRVSRKEYLILEKLIEHGEMFGLQLVQRMPTELTRSTVYITMQRMASKKLVISRLVEDSAGGPARRLYRPSGSGFRLYNALRQEYAMLLKR